MERALGLGKDPLCLIRLGGNEAVVGVQLKVLEQNTRPEEVDAEIWAKLRNLDDSADSVIRISSLPVRFLGTAARILGEDIPGVYTYIDPRRGVMRIVVVNNSENDGNSQPALGSTIDLRSDSGASSEIIFEKLPTDVWPRVSPSVISDPLSQGIRKAYDPLNILNPGILGD